MKFSNIIALTLSVIVIVSILVLFTDAKNHENYIDPNIEMKTFPLSEFSVIVVGQGAIVHVDYAKSNAIEVEYFKNNLVKMQVYKLQNDTLFVHSGLRTFVKVNNLKLIQGHNPGRIGIGIFSLDSLHINIAGGYLELRKVNNKKSKIKNLTINSSDYARVVASETEVDNLILNTTDKSTCDIWGKCKKVNATLKTNSDVFFKHNPENLQIERDKDSRFRIE